MAYEIGRFHKIGKLNRKILDNTTEPSSAPSTHSYSYYKLNENTDITSKKYYQQRHILEQYFSLEDKPSDIIKGKSESKL